MSILQSVERVFTRRLCRSDVRNHHCARLTNKRLSQNVSEFALSVRCVVHLLVDAPYALFQLHTAMTTVKKNNWTVSVLRLVVLHSFAVYYLRFLCMILEALIEGWHGSCITGYQDDINVICELLAVKHGDLQLDMFSNSVLDAFIAFLCTS